MKVSNSLTLLVVLTLLGCGTDARPQEEDIPTYAVRILKTLAHDQGAFTQGFAVEGNVAYEGTGQYGQSTLRRVALDTGEVEQKISLHSSYFGEGITVLGDRLYQLTWKKRVCIVYDKNTLKPLGTLPYTKQGWGLATDGKVMYMSDGTNTIRVIDPETFKVIRRFRLRHGRRNIDNLNELEFVEGKLLANIWYSDYIAEIDPESGRITAWIDCSKIYPQSTRPNREHVLNGIAYDAETKALYVTGKNWPHVYQIEVIKSSDGN